MDTRICTFSNFLTVIRIILTFPAWFFLSTAVENNNVFYYGIGLFLCLSAALTDFFDGYVAQQYDQKTRIGTLLDPVADKIFSLWVLYALAAPVWLILVMVTRDIWVTSLRTIWNKNVETSIFAKWKTAILFCFIIATIVIRIFYSEINPWNVSEWHWVNFTTITLLLTILTGIHYSWLTFKK